VALGWVSIHAQLGCCNAKGLLSLADSAAGEYRFVSGQAGFVLCADDYALTPGVSAGILRLLEAGRISATGAMTGRPSWRQAAADLKPYIGRADLGLHLNLTTGEPLGPMPGLAPSGSFPALGKVLRASLLRRFDRREIAQEITRQLAAFEDTLGVAPDFVDGHQHVHVLNGIRQPLLRVLAERYPNPAARPYLRDPADSPLAIAARRHAGKALIVAGFASGFNVAARRAGFAVNRGFSGFSAFDTRADYGAEFRACLTKPGARHLVMCHPGLVDDALRSIDSVVETRPRELEFLAGPAFAALCAEMGVEPVRFGAL
jgi:predicted glycoside hydrolase/deacetylase ChbG (UPF0249 family)